MRNVTLGLMAGALMRMAAAGGMPEREQRRLARQFGVMKGRSGGGIARELNLRGMPAYNLNLTHHSARAEGVGVGEYDAVWSERRNAAKARRRALRAQGARP
jgi:hypothetical protein